MASFQYGFDNTLMSTMQASPSFLRVFGFPDPQIPGGYGISSTVQQLLTSLMTVGGFVGSLVTGYIGNQFGRRVGLWIGCGVTFVAVAIMTGSLNIGAIYFARVLIGIPFGKADVGFGNSLMVSFAILYTGECAPAVLRGIIVVEYEFFLGIGALIALIVNNYCSTMVSYAGFRIPMGILLIIPFFLSLALLWYPDTPRQLVYKKDIDGARNALLRLHGSTIATPEWIDKHIAETQAAIELEESVVSASRWLDMFRGTDLRRTIIVVGIALCRVASGLQFLSLYGVYFFLISGSTKPFIDTIIITCAGIAGGFLSYVLTRLCGRRTIMLWGSIVCGLSMMGLSAAYTANPNSQDALKALVGFLTIYYFS
jgi:MFS family permease